LFAAFADGAKSEAEREHLKDVVAGFGNPSMSEALRRVVLKETTVEAEVALLDREELRTLAWEAALGVCEADGATSPAERTFLDALAAALKRPISEARRDVSLADALDEGATSAHVPPPVPVAAAPAVSVATDARAAQVDASVLRYAILTSAIELLPQGLATLAIIPLQTKMVHGVGSTYGYTLTAASIKEFAATIGIGATGQAIEGYARRILGSLAGSVLGGLGRTAANWATGPAMTFATTYAIGMVAKQYYAGGRTLGAIDLKTLFSQQVEQAKGLYERYEPQVRQTAANTNPAQLLASLRA
jgi:uncharacterized protein (DUF697 family)